MIIIMYFYSTLLLFLHY